MCCNGYDDGALAQTGMQNCAVAKRPDCTHRGIVAIRRKKKKDHIGNLTSDCRKNIMIVSENLLLLQIHITALRWAERVSR
jgi:hypothetical protein